MTLRPGRLLEDALGAPEGAHDGGRESQARPAVVTHTRQVRRREVAEHRTRRGVAPQNPRPT